jgi:hypothetical protein
MYLKIYFNTGDFSKLFELLKSSERQSACKSPRGQTKLRYASVIGKRPVVLSYSERSVACN